MRPAARCAVAAALLASGACSLFSPSPLSVGEIFARPDGHRVPVIVVPGVVGSILGDSKTGAVGWVRSAEAFLLAHSTNLALPGEDGTDPDRITSLGILERVQVVPGLLAFQQFEPVLDALRQAGYTLGSSDFPRPEEDAFVFHFDFRRDAVDTVKQLALAIERVRSTRKDPTEKVALLTQSYGGLIARYYLMYGDRDVCAEDSPTPTGAGVEDVSHVVFFGTPQTGALVLFQILREGYVVGLNGSVMSPEVMSTFPSAYQVLPHPSENVFVDLSMQPYLDPSGEPLSLYDAATWVKLGWIGKARQTDANMARLDRYLHRAKSWWNALEQPWSPPPSVAFLSVVGGTRPTPNRAIVNLEETGQLSVMFEAPSGTPNQDRLNRVGPVREPGDGRVTLESALTFPHGGRLFTDEEHDLIHQDPSVLKNVLMFLVHPTSPVDAEYESAVRARAHEFAQNLASSPIAFPRELVTLDRGALVRESSERLHIRRAHLDTIKNSFDEGAEVSDPIGDHKLRELHANAHAFLISDQSVWVVVQRERGIGFEVSSVAIHLISNAEGEWTPESVGIHHDSDIPDPTWLEDVGGELQYEVDTSGPLPRLRARFDLEGGSDAAPKHHVSGAFECDLPKAPVVAK